MTKEQKCQCADKGCSLDHGSDIRFFTCDRSAEYTMYRIDMQDATGTPMCEPCAFDAFESGLFESDVN